MNLFFVLFYSMDKWMSDWNSPKIVCSAMCIVVKWIDTSVIRVGGIQRNKRTICY